MLLHFAVLPITAVVVLITTLLFSRYSGARAGRGRLLWGLIPLAVLTALVPNAGQRMYDLGFSTPVIDRLEMAGLYLFVFTFTGAWTLIGRDRRRWLLIVLVPVAFFEWLKGTWTFLVWSIWGFRA